jgi:hypothetical protein
MRSVLTLIALFICLYVPGQKVFNQNRWSTNTVIGVNDFKFNAKPGTIILDTLNKQYPYGNISEFLPDGRFISHNIGPCGNECRIMCKGTYTVTKNTITLFITSLSYAKDCKNTPPEEINTLLGTYQWEQKGTKLILTPIVTDR